MAKEMLINVSEGEECRIALLDDGRLEELYMERTSATSHVGNIYKGRVTNVEASIQAAFIDFGLGRNGFLHISDLMPTYFGRRGEDIVETVGKKMARRDRPPIQRCLRRGDEIVVQIIKEGIGTKGPTLSTYLSIPGRILVMMPGMGKMGVSRKIEDDPERRRLRQILDQLKPPKDVGFIIRTAGVGRPKTDIERDLKYLTRLWEQLEKKRKSSPAPVELYTEGDLVTRTVRDFFSADLDRIVVDSEEVAKRVKEVIKISTPRAKNKVELYEETVPLFHKYGIEREIEMMYSRHVPLPSGGSLVIDSTEAIVAIDVNSGKFREHNDAEMTAFKTDMEAADEIPRQLKLRDLGGVIICDFIDLRYERNRRELEKRLHDNFKNDRAKTKVLRMSQFGIIEMTRQRMRPSLKRSIYFDCPHCKGAGLVKTPESMSLDVMRRISIAINDLKVARVELAVCPDVAFYLLNKKRVALAELEQKYKKRVLIRSDQTLGLDEMKLELFDGRDGLVVLPELDAALSQPTHRTQLNTRPHGRPQPARGGGGGQQAGGRFDSRRDQVRRGPGPQQPQQRGGSQQQQRPSPRDEDDLGEDRYELDDEQEPAARGGDGSHEPEDNGQREDAGGAVENSSGQPGNRMGGEGGEGGEGPRRRRRRRRGRRGRGRGRNQEGQEFQAAQDEEVGEQGGAPVDDSGEQQFDRHEEGGEGPEERDTYADSDFDRSEPLGEAPGEIVVENDEGDEVDVETSEPAEASTPETKEEEQRPRGRRRGRRGGRGRGGKSAPPEEPEKSEVPAPEAKPESEGSEEGETGEAPKRRRRRGGRGRGRGKKSTEGSAESGGASSPSANASSTTKRPEIPRPPVVRTGSTDRHLMSEDAVDVTPVVPEVIEPIEPVRRLRSRRDLDEIPDDFDDR
jgi:ribonuclease E